MDVRFKHYDCEIQFAEYMNGNTAIQLMDKIDGSLVATASVNGDTKKAPEIVGIKDWSENEGMISALISAGVIGNEIITIEQSGFVDIFYFKLTDAAIQELNKQK